MNPPRLLFAIASAALLSQCESIKKVTSAIPLPALPDMTQVKRMLPGSGADNWTARSSTTGSEYCGLLDIFHIHGTGRL